MAAAPGPSHSPASTGGDTTPGVAQPGYFSWTWLEGPKATAADLATFQAAHAYATKVLAQFHKEAASGPQPIGCLVCHPPHMNVERK